MSSDVLETKDISLAMPIEDGLSESDDGKLALSTENATPPKYVVPSPIREYPTLEFGEPKESLDSELDDMAFDDLFDTPANSSSATKEMQEKIDSYETRIEELSLNLEECRAQNKSALKELDSSKANADKLYNKCQELLERVSEAERKLKEAEEEKTALSENSDNLSTTESSKMEEYEKKISELQEEIETLNLKINSVEESSENMLALRDTCNDLQTACAEKDKQIEELEAEVASLREMLKSDEMSDEVIPGVSDYPNAKVVMGDKVDIDKEVNSESGNIVNVPYMNQNLQSVRRTIPARTEQVTNIKNIIS